MNSSTIPAVFALKAASKAGMLLRSTKRAPGSKGFEIFAILRLARNGEGAQRAAVKRIFERDDFELGRGNGMAMGANHFERAFHGFRSGITKKAAV